MKTFKSHVFGVFLFVISATSALAAYEYPGELQGKMEVNPNGAATYSIPIEVPPGVNGLQPTLVLNYNSQAGNGVLGVAWNLLGLSAITRCPATYDQDGFNRGVHIDNNDRFCLDGQRLVVVSGSYGAANSQYRTEADSVSTITAYYSASVDPGPGFFRIKTKDGKILIYGGTSGGASVAQQGGNNIIRWNLRTIVDSAGNGMQFSYSTDPALNNQGFYPITRIDYNTKISGVSTSVRFSYEARGDTVNHYLAGSKMFVPQRMASIQTYVGEQLVRDYQITYKTSKQVSKSLVNDIKECDTAGCVSLSRSRDFLWQDSALGGFAAQGALNTFVNNNVGGALFDISRINYGDFNGDGIQDVYYVNGWGTSTTDSIYLGNGNGSFAAATNGLTTWVGGNLDGANVDLSRIKFADFDGDGTTDIYYVNGWGSSATDQVYLNSGSGTFGAGISSLSTWVGNNAGGALLDISRIKFGDFNGDGRTDIYYINGWGSSATDKVYLGKGDGTFTTGVNGLSSWVASNLDGANVDVARFKLGDFNGDGCTDIYYVNGWGSSGTDKVYLSNCDGTFAAGVNGLATWVGSNAGGALLDISRINLEDFNGDGLTDIYYIKGWGTTTTDMVYLGRGNGTLAPGVNGLSTWVAGNLNGANIDVSRFKFADLNGDGCRDIYYVNGWGSSAIDKMYLSQCDGTFAAGVNGLATWVASNTGGASVDISRIRVTDFSGDGVADVYLANGWGSTVQDTVQVNKTVHQLISDITGGYLLSTHINYVPMTDKSVYTKNNSRYPYQSVQNSTYVVKGYSENHGAGTYIHNVGYTYSGAKRHLRGRGFLGFERVVKTDYSSNIVTTTSYYQKANTIDDYSLSPASKDFWRTGKMRYQYQTQGGKYLSYRYNGWVSTVSDAGVVIPYLYYDIEYSYDFGSVVSNKRTYIPSTFTDAQGALKNSVDAYGNVWHKEQSSYDYARAKNYVQATDTTYYPADTTYWLVGLVKDVTTTTTVPGEFAEMPATDTKTQKVAYKYYASTPRVWQEITEPDLPSSDSAQSIKVYQYDTYGNRSGVYLYGAGISPARSTTMAYDYSYAADKYQVTITNALGQKEKRIYDWRTGNMLAMIGPNQILGANGFTTEWQYDGFGRKRKEIRADGTQTTWDYTCLTTVCSPVNGFVYTVTRADSGGPSVTTYYDQYGRKTLNTKKGYNNRVVMQQIQYDNLGRIKGQTDNYYQSINTAYWTCYEYDSIGRIRRQTLPSTSGCDYPANLATFKTATYTGLQTTETVYNDGQNGPQTQVTKKWKNALGQLVQVQDAQNNTPTQYSYDALGKLAGFKDAKGNILRTYYDVRGRKIAMDDPDMGHWEYAYNAADELVWQKDAKLQVVNMTYDALGRIKTRSEPDGSTTTWSYDTANKGIGKLASVQNDQSGYARSQSYDNYGRPSWVNNQVLFENYRTDTSYDLYGRVDIVTYPTSVGGTRFQVKNCYDANGYLKEVRAPGTCFTGGTVYWQANDMNADGNVTSETLGNGITSTRQYDDMWGQLTDIGASKGTTTYQSSHYVYDRLGNLEERDFSSKVGAIQDVTETFSYDPLNRLTKATTTGPFAVGTISKTYAYDALGNITSKSDFGDAYSYDGSNGAGPHAVTRVSKGASTVATYSYDANGNMSSGAGRTMSYTWFNKPLSVSKGASYSTFAYDSEHNRVVQTSEHGSTVYIDPLVGSGGHYDYEKEYAGGVTTHKHYIHGADGSVVAVYIKKDNGAADQTHYFLKDHLGSIEVVTDQAGKQLERLSYDAFGKRRNIDGSDAVGQLIAQATNLGYTGHEHLDNVSLIHMNGRLYDPTLGRFLSADPFIQQAANPQSYNRYSYVLNNPLSITDPSGFLWKKLKHWVKKTVKKVGHWLEEHKEQIKNVVYAALIVATVFYGGAFLLTAELNAAVVTGAAIGAVVGGYAGYQAGGWSGALRGAVFGAAVGALGAGAGASLSAGYSGATAGAIQGGFDGFATGMGLGYQGGKGNFTTMRDASLVGAAAGAVTGAALGYADEWLSAKPSLPNGGVMHIQSTHPSGMTFKFNGINADMFRPVLHRAYMSLSPATIAVFNALVTDAASAYTVTHRSQVRDFLNAQAKKRSVSYNCTYTTSRNCGLSGS